MLLTFITPDQMASHLKYARKARKLTQAQVATRLALSQNRVSHLERHPAEINLQQLLTWCAVVGLELSVGERNNQPRTEPW